LLSAGIYRELGAQNIAHRLKLWLIHQGGVHKILSTNETPVLLSLWCIKIWSGKKNKKAAPNDIQDGFLPNHQL